MRIVSLLPSATEILFAVGLDDEIVGVSHECDYPPQAKTKRAVIQSRIPQGLSPSEVDRQVREYVSRGESLYSVDMDALETLAPHLIVTQDLCHVCAATPGDLAAALTRFVSPPRVLSLNPQDLAGVFGDILKVGEATGRAGRATALVAELQSSLAAIEGKVAGMTSRPRVVFLEWLDPLYVGGHWVPEMIARASGSDALGKIRTPSFRVTPEQVIAAAPDILLIAPCGYSAGQARAEYLQTSFPAAWSEIPAVRSGRVFALDAAGYYSRPGPRLIRGMESLAEIFHPAIEATPETEQAILPIAERVRTARTASV